MELTTNPSAEITEQVPGILEKGGVIYSRVAYTTGEPAVGVLSTWGSLEPLIPGHQIDTHLELPAVR